MEGMFLNFLDELFMHHKKATKFQVCGQNKVKKCLIVLCILGKFT